MKDSIWRYFFNAFDLRAVYPFPGEREQPIFDVAAASVDGANAPCSAHAAIAS
jgi:hypothetical protein